MNIFNQLHVAETLHGFMCTSCLLFCVFYLECMVAASSQGLKACKSVLKYLNATRAVYRKCLEGILMGLVKN